MKPKEIAYIGMSIALLFISGYVVYWISKPLLLPGAKFLLMAPLLTFLQYTPMLLRPKATTLVFFNLGFGVLLLAMSPLMAVAILLSGLFSGIVFKVLSLFRVLSFAMHWGVASYVPFAMLVSFFISVEITGLFIYGDTWSFTVFVVAFVCLILGRFGTQMAEGLASKVGLTSKGSQ